MLLPYSTTRAFVPKTFRTFEQQSSHSSACLFMGDFKRVNLFKINLQGIIINKKVSSATTNSKTCIDLIFKNLPETQSSFLILETHFSDHWGVCALTNCFWMYM